DARGSPRAHGHLMTGEIVARGGMTEFGPAFFAPVIDDTRAAHQGFEPLGLADRRIGRMPEQPEAVARAADLTQFHRMFKTVQCVVRSADIEIDEVHWK